MNHPARMVTLQSLKPDKVYSNGREILDDVLDRLEIPLSEFERNKKEWRNILPIHHHAYWDYVDDTREGCGVFSRINLEIEEKVGYKLTSFGIEVKEKVVPRFIELSLKYGVNLLLILGHVAGHKSGERIIRFKRYVSYEELKSKLEGTKYIGNARKAVEVLKLIKQKGSVLEDELMKDLKMSKGSLRRYVMMLKKVGAVEVELKEGSTRAPLEVYKILKYVVEDYEKGRHVSQKDNS